MTRACILALCLAWTLHAQPTDTLHIRPTPSHPDADQAPNPTYVATYQASSRATSGITIEITTASGQPVEGAMVTLQMPSSGPSGLFRNSAKTEILTTGPDGKVEAWGMLWNATQGSVTLRITASKGTDHGTATATVQLTAPPPRAISRDTGTGVHGHKKLWIAIAAVGASSFAVAALASKPGSNSSTTPPPANTAIVISPPTIVITRPSAR